jgi:vitellogenic carboxypeptidase-like protein
LLLQVSYSGFLTVNKTHNSSLFFWFFPSENKAAESPLILWLQGGPGWPTMYGLFKENGPFLVGWDEFSGKPQLLRNIYSWTANHNLLYIDNPVGTGFSYTTSDDGYPETDEQLAREVLEGLTQFMLMYPSMVPGANPAKTPFYAFGESYGGAYVVSLAHVYLQYRHVFSFSTNTWPES